MARYCLGSYGSLVFLYISPNPNLLIAHLNASLLISNTNIISSPPVHPIPPHTLGLFVRVGCHKEAATTAQAENLSFNPSFIVFKCPF